MANLLFDKSAIDAYRARKAIKGSQDFDSKQQNKQGFIPAAVDKIFNTPIVGPILNAGLAAEHQIGQAGANILNLGARGLGAEKPIFQSNEDWSQPGLSQTIGHFAGDIFPYIAASEFAPFAAPGLAETEALGGLTGWGAGIGARTAGNAAYGASQNPYDVQEGATEAALWGLPFETLGPAGSALKYGAEKIIPNELLKNIGQKLSSGYQGAKQTIQENLYNPTIEKFGAQRVAWKDLVGDLKNPRFYKYYTPEIKKMIEDIELGAKTEKGIPHARSLRFLHDMQSKLFKDISKVEPQSENAAQALKYARNKVKKSIGKEFEKRGLDKEAKMYNKASEDWVENVIPYEVNSGLEDIASGAREKAGMPLESNELQNILGEANLFRTKQNISREKFGKEPFAEHPVQSENKRLAEALKSAETWKGLSNIGLTVGGGVAGAGLSSLFGMDPKFGASLGLLGGAYGNKAGYLAKAIQNPRNQELIHKLGMPVADLIKAGLITL